MFWELATRGEPVNTFELKVRQPEGQALRVSVTAVVVLGPGEDEYGVVYLMRPIYRRRRADEVIDRILSMSGHELQRIVGSDDDGERPEQQLTRREIEVLRLLSQGNSSEEIAHTLKVSLAHRAKPRSARADQARRPLETGGGHQGDSDAAVLRFDAGCSETPRPGATLG